MRPRRPLGPLAALLAVTALVAGCTSSSGRTSSDAPSSAPAPTSSSSLSPPASTSTSVPASSSAVRAPARLGSRSGLAVPDRGATPGAALAGVTRVKVCTKDWNADHSTIALPVQNAVAARYAVVAGEGTSLRLDQLIPASLGGTATADNVWPQPKTQARKKNVLEARLHQLVCAGQLSLRTAQDAMAQDWTAAARKYPPA